MYYSSNTLPPPPSPSFRLTFPVPRRQNKLPPPLPPLPGALGLYFGGDKRGILIASLFTNSISSTGGEHQRNTKGEEREVLDKAVVYIGSPVSFYLSLQLLDFPLHINFSFQSVTRRSYLFSDPFSRIFPPSRPFPPSFQRRPSSSFVPRRIHRPRMYVCMLRPFRVAVKRGGGAYTRRLSCIHVDGN